MHYLIQIHLQQLIICRFIVGVLLETSYGAGVLNVLKAFLYETVEISEGQNL